MTHSPRPVPPRRALRAARKEMGLTQRDLGKALGLARLTVLDIENGRRQPSFETMSKWARFLDVSLDLFDTAGADEVDQKAAE